jgi:hypothetical protein
MKLLLRLSDWKWQFSEGGINERTWTLKILKTMELTSMIYIEH